jgi:hypothetical protein
MSEKRKKYDREFREGRSGSSRRPESRSLRSLVTSGSTKARWQLGDSPARRVRAAVSCLGTTLRGTVALSDVLARAPQILRLIEQEHPRSACRNPERGRTWTAQPSRRGSPQEIFRRRDAGIA